MPPTKLALQIYESLEQIKDSSITTLDPPDTRIPWPGENRTFWPAADISGIISNGDIFIVEVDEHTDPCRSLIKYWPLIHTISIGKFNYPPIHFYEISSRDNTFGSGFQKLAKFISKRLESQYKNFYRFGYSELIGKGPKQHANDILKFIKFVSI